MATIRERLWQTGKTVKRAWAVTFVNRDGKRQQMTFDYKANAEWFLERVKVQEEKWRAERFLAGQMEQPQ